MDGDFKYPSSPVAVHFPQLLVELFLKITFITLSDLLAILKVVRNDLASNLLFLETGADLEWHMLLEE